ncbi:hypothetical protein HCU01_22450 [Halomonas cupida]|uniref:Uncharacterized protein n=1 Tax=Halomonas cupida TaxID=44933 RepID=A0A1M7J330_9GAMM|nr:hypothetical protein [Halomonas cupida]GEN24296.1 hypothetical protein HCU01_22450 [Halomonas cupida]SHM47381.1 hypothetical protein SAMN05660971_03087 [Halomonas cupida]
MTGPPLALCWFINPARFHVGLMTTQGRAAVGHQADNQIDQDELFGHVNSVGGADWTMQERKHNESVD